jgi:glycopeptide antibiotics resistance protein
MRVVFCRSLLHGGHMTKKNYQIMIGWVIAAIYIVVLLKITVLRQDFLQYPLFTHGAVSFLPLYNYIRILLKGDYFFFVYLFFGNIAWFIPFGFLMPFLTGRPKTLVKAAACGLLLSFLIELGQFAFGTGESELDDLLLNTLGTALGYLIYRYRFRLTGKKK